MPTTSDDSYWLQVTPVKWYADKWKGYIEDVEPDEAGKYVYHQPAGKWIQLVVKNLSNVSVNIYLCSQQDVGGSKWYKSQSSYNLEPHEEDYSFVFQVNGHPTDWSVKSARYDVQTREQVEQRTLLHLQFVSVEDVGHPQGETVHTACLLRQLLDFRSVVQSSE